MSVENAGDFARVVDAWDETVPIGSVQYHSDMAELTDYINRMCNKGKPIIRESGNESAIINMCKVATSLFGRTILSPIVGDNPDNAPPKSIDAIMMTLVATVTFIIGAIVTEGLFDDKPLNFDDIARSLTDADDKQD